MPPPPAPREGVHLTRKPSWSCLCQLPHLQNANVSPQGGAMPHKPALPSGALCHGPKPHAQRPSSVSPPQNRQLQVHVYLTQKLKPQNRVTRPACWSWSRSWDSTVSFCCSQRRSSQAAASKNKLNCSSNERDQQQKKPGYIPPRPSGVPAVKPSTCPVVNSRLRLLCN